MQYKTITIFKVKIAYGTAVSLQSATGKKRKANVSLILNVRRHCNDTISDG